MGKFYQARDFFWINKGWIVGGVCASYLVWKSISYTKEYLRSSCAEEKLPVDKGKGKEQEAPKVKPPVEMPKLTLTFCIDKSHSMKGNRENQVKKGIQDVLDHALGVVKKQKGAEVVISAVTFNDYAQTICKPTTINKETIGQIKKNLSYSSNGSTRILKGLEKATTVLEHVEEKYPESTHVLIFLSDGVGSCHGIQGIHKWIEKVRVRLFAIGIGGAQEFTSKRWQSLTIWF